MAWPAAKPIVCPVGKPTGYPTDDYIKDTCQEVEVAPPPPKPRPGVRPADEGRGVGVVDAAHEKRVRWDCCRNEYRILFLQGTTATRLTHSGRLHKYHFGHCVIKRNL